MNIMEQQIWDYLDGTCSEQERKKIAQLIETDPAYQMAYADLEKLHRDLSGMELDEPSMSFTRNVMDQVKSLPVPGSIRSLIDKRIVYGIGGFFIFSIMLLLTSVFSQIDWSQPARSALPELKVPQLDYTSLAGSTYLRVFFFADLVLGLYILDSVMRKKLLSK
jgi:anti-sigma factor RsiW